MQWSQSHFLQALGWATLNSFWQMAILWCLFAGANHVFRLSANARYRGAVGALLIGFGWFVTTFVLYYQNQSSAYAFFQNTIPHSNNLLKVCLLSASVTYLLLLVFPAVRLFRNWRFVQVIKKEGVEKASLHYRLFVYKIAAHLGIRKKVKLVFSNLVTSPITVGYLKPMILLPVAAMNQLTTAQVEAILLHELSHIRRYDYLVNFIVSIIHTLLYFNPFVKFFMNAVESERETCCDELVLQFGYDKVGYASALLHLEKTSGKYKALALAAAGKQNLLTRIEKIVGMEKKKTFRLIQIVPLFAALFCILLFNSVLIIQDAKLGSAMSYTSDAVFMPWQFEGHSGKKGTPVMHKALPLQSTAAPLTETAQLQIDIVNEPPAEEVIPATESPIAEGIVPVGFDDNEGHLTTEQKQDVNTAVEATKKVVQALKWKEIDAAIADALSKKEKAFVKQQLYQAVEAIDWKQVKQNLKAGYENVNWPLVRENLNLAMAQVQLDSIQTVYAQALSELDKMQSEVNAKATVKCTPLPDCSVEQLNAAKATLRKNLDSLRAAKPKKVVQL